jgi:uncharacterized protein with HEPN domain
MSRECRNWEDNIFDIINAVEYIEEFIHDVSFKEFIKDKKTNFAVIRSLEVIEEGAKRIPHHIRKEYPGIPWKDIACIKDNLVHSDFGIDFKGVWQIITEKIPSIKPKFRKIITKQGSE